MDDLKVNSDGAISAMGVKGFHMEQ